MLVPINAFALVDGVAQIAPFQLLVTTATTVVDMVVALEMTSVLVIQAFLALIAPLRPHVATYNIAVEMAIVMEQILAIVIRDGLVRIALLHHKFNIIVQVIATGMANVSAQTCALVIWDGLVQIVVCTHPILTHALALRTAVIMDSVWLKISVSAYLVTLELTAWLFPLVAGLITVQDMEIASATIPVLVVLVGLVLTALSLLV